MHLQSERDQLLQQCDVSKAKYERLESEKVDLLRNLERRQVEVDQLNGQLESSNDRIKELRNEVIKKDSMLANVHSKFSTCQLQLELTKEETTRQHQLVEWNAKELEQTLVEFGEFRRQKSGELAALQSRAETLTAQLPQLEEQVRSLRSLLQEKDQKIEEMSRKVRDVESLAVEQEALYIQELSSKTRLCDLYKEAMDEATARLESYEVLIRDSQNVEQRIKQQEEEYKNLFLS